MSTPAEILGPQDGARIPGGCDYCEAYQTLRLVEKNIYSLTVHHDDDCPELKRKTR